MKELRSQALVLRVRSLGEADKLITLFTRSTGKISAVARGSRKTKSKFSALVEPLTFGNFLLHQGKTLYSFMQGEFIKSYSHVLRDLEKLAYAQYFCEVCERCLPEGEPAEDLFLLLLTALENLESDLQPARVARCFELSLLDELGLRPSVESCYVCGKTNGPFRFDPATGSLLCADCPHPPDSIPVSAGALAAMKRLLELGFYKLSVCNIQEQANKDIRLICAAMLGHALDIHNLKSLQFLHETDFL